MRWLQHPSAKDQDLARQLADHELIRQESLRTMAGSVAHHFNNLLTGLMGGLELAAYNLEAGQSPRKELTDCLAITQRAAELSHLMLLYVGEGGRERKVLLLGPLIQLHLAARRAGGRLAPPLELEGSPLAARLLGHEELLLQLLDRLLDNAEEATQEAVERIRIRIRAGCHSFKAGDLAHSQVPLAPDPAGNPFLEVEDQGCGMSAEVLERAFDPFYTTHFTGRGMGLAVVSGIVRLHHGGLKCVSEPGRGTRVSIIFPRHEGVGHRLNG